MKVSWLAFLSFAFVAFSLTVDKKKHKDKKRGGSAIVKVHEGPLPLCRKAVGWTPPPRPTNKPVVEYPFNGTHIIPPWNDTEAYANDWLLTFKQIKGKDPEVVLGKGAIEARAASNDTQDKFIKMPCNELPKIPMNWGLAEWPKEPKQCPNQHLMDKPLREQLKAMLESGVVTAKHDVSNVVSWTVTDETYAFYTKPWSERFLKAGIDQPLYVSLNPLTTQWLCASGMPVVQYPPAKAGSTFSTMSYIGGSKFDVALAIAELGYIGYFMELDAHIIRNPFPKLFQDAGIATNKPFAKNDTLKIEFMVNKELRGTTELNIGIWFALPTDNVIKMFRLIYNLYITGNPDTTYDQKFVNAYLKLWNYRNCFGADNTTNPDAILKNKNRKRDPAGYQIDFSRHVCDYFEAKQKEDDSFIKWMVMERIQTQAWLCRTTANVDALHTLAPKWWKEQGVANKYMVAKNNYLFEGETPDYYEEVPSDTKYLTFDQRTPAGREDQMIKGVASALDRQRAGTMMGGVLSRVSSRVFVYPSQVLPKLDLPNEVNIPSWGEDLLHPLTLAKIGVDTRESMFFANPLMATEKLFPVARVTLGTGLLSHYEIINCTGQQEAAWFQTESLYDLLKVKLKDIKTVVVGLQDPRDYLRAVTVSNRRCIAFGKMMKILTDFSCPLDRAFNQRHKSKCLGFNGYSKQFCGVSPQYTWMKGTRVVSPDITEDENMVTVRGLFSAAGPPPDIDQGLYSDAPSGGSAPVPRKARKVNGMKFSLMDSEFGLKATTASGTKKQADAAAETTKAPIANVDVDAASATPSPAGTSAPSVSVAEEKDKKSKRKKKFGPNPVVVHIAETDKTVGRKSSDV